MGTPAPMTGENLETDASVTLAPDLACSQGRCPIPEDRLRNAKKVTINYQHQSVSHRP